MGKLYNFREGYMLKYGENPEYVQNGEIEMRITIFAASGMSLSAYIYIHMYILESCCICADHYIRFLPYIYVCMYIYIYMYVYIYIYIYIYS